MPDLIGAGGAGVDAGGDSGCREMGIGIQAGHEVTGTWLPCGVGVEMHINQARSDQQPR